LSEPFRSDLVPPGVHVACDFTWEDEKGSHSAQVRILGDENRGYLLMGLERMPDADEQEFWFRTLDEARAAAAEYGVPADGWGDVGSADELQLSGVAKTRR
jgi:hypothetical protein